MCNANWKEEKIDVVFKMWIDASKTVNDIAIFLGLKSRRSIYVVAKRLNWPKRAINKKPKSISKVNNYVVKKKKTFGGLVKMIDIKDHQCREIIGQPKNGIMCGMHIDRGSYCKHHADINYTKSTFKPLVKS